MITARTPLLIAMVFAFSLPYYASETARPTSRFTVTCAVGSRQCTLNGKSSLAATSYRWDFGTGQPQELRDSVTNTFPVGTWCVRLVVKDAGGDSSYATKLITLPFVSGTKFGACPASPATPPVRVDTVMITRHDTIAMLVALPTPLPTMSGIYIDSAMIGQAIRFYRVCLLGMGASKIGGAVEVFPNRGWSPPANQITIGFFPSAGVARTLSDAAAQLDTTIAGCKP